MGLSSEQTGGWRSTVAANLGHFVAPLTLAFTGMLYISGSAYWGVGFSILGLDSNLFKMSIQDTLAMGYLPILASFVAIAISIAIAMTLSWLISRLFPGLGSRNWLRKFMKKIEKPMMRFSIFYLTLVFLTVGLISGSALGSYAAFDIKSSVAANCSRRCFVYQVGVARYVGVLVVQDQVRTIVYTREGARFLKTDEISLVTSYTP